jgi:hypothetical protein
MGVLTRKQFSEHFDSLREGLGTDSTSPLWVPEETLNSKCEHFINVCPRVTLTINHSPERNVFWDWCLTNLNGQVRCFSSSETDEWWGFTDASDVSVWLLKWT